MVARSALPRSLSCSRSKRSAARFWGLPAAGSPMPRCAVSTSTILEVLITLALVTGAYAIALKLHLSGPIAVVVAGLFIGNHGARFAMSERTRTHVFQFWELIDEILNSVLFLLIGLEVLVIAQAAEHLGLALLAIPLVLVARFIAVATPISLLALRQTFTPGAIRLLTWGGLRGGISVALALSLPEGEYKPLILTMTYVVVVFLDRRSGAERKAAGALFLPARRAGRVRSHCALGRYPINLRRPSAHTRPPMNDSPEAGRVEARAGTDSMGWDCAPSAMPSVARPMAWLMAVPPRVPKDPTQETHGGVSQCRPGENPFAVNRLARGDATQTPAST